MQNSPSLPSSTKQEQFLGESLECTLIRLVYPKARKDFLDCLMFQILADVIIDIEIQSIKLTQFASKC